MARFIVLVIDSYGVGYMDDVLQVRPRDYGANTCRHILDSVPDLYLPHFERLGLMNALGCDYKKMKMNGDAVFGKSRLQHYGGDTFLGHQEIMGTRTQKPLMKPFSFYIDQVEAALKAAGHSVVRRKQNAEYLWVDDCVAVADNLETDPGQVYNVTTSFRNISFEKELEIAQIVRSVVEVERVIVFGGTKATTESIFAAETEREGKYIGIDAPKSLVYEEGYMVRHLGYGVVPEVQLPFLLGKKNIPCILIGKVADIVANASGKSFLNLVDTKTILDVTIERISLCDHGFICVNVQETDLAGHAQNPERYAEVLGIVDGYIGKIIRLLKEDDILVVTADHGNDPTIGHSQHTREYVPLLIYKQGVRAVNIGVRKTMADTAATAAEFFSAEKPEAGESYLSYLV
ncbi:phosphopentomutase [Treponema socranskii]|uniref:phosphopentomutase n=1 Tax=Treponema socranskii TaxID=53419 RepID=UPI003D6FF4A4